MNNLTGKVALITGGSKGIGLGIAESLVRSGMNVAVTSRTQSPADKAAEILNQIGPGKAVGIASDVRDLNSNVETVKRVIDEFGKLDVFIANAGLGKFGSVEEITKEEWDEVIDVNLTGVFYGIKAVAEAIKNTKGYIITIASLAGTNFFAGGAAYNASKFGLVGFTQAVMLDLRKYGVKVSTIMPGSVTSYFNEHTPNKDDDWKIQPEDLGQMVVDLLRMNPRTLPSKIEVRPTTPPGVK